LRASLFKAFVTECPTKYQDREKLPVKNKLTVVALDVPKFNGSLLVVGAVTLAGVPEDDIFRFAVARQFGKFKPSSNVPFEADIYVPVQVRIIIVRNDVFELLIHKRHKRAFTLIPRCGVLEALLRAETRKWS
jgi:hypothetical protein